MIEAEKPLCLLYPYDEQAPGLLEILLNPDGTRTVLLTNDSGEWLRGRIIYSLPSCEFSVIVPFDPLIEVVQLADSRFTILP
jgi:hypothetical protein